MSDQHSAVAETIATLNRQWMAAYTTRDVAFLDRHMADDYVGTFPDGTVHDKQSEIDGVSSGTIVIKKMVPSEMTVRVYDNAAVLTGQSSVDAIVNGYDTHADLRFTDVWIKEGEQWRAVASQVTRIERPDAVQGSR